MNNPFSWLHTPLPLVLPHQAFYSSLIFVVVFNWQCKPPWFFHCNLTRSNFSPSVCTSLISDQSDLVIKPAYMEVAVVVWCTNLYLVYVRCQLCGIFSYLPLDYDLVNKHQIKKNKNHLSSLFPLTSRHLFCSPPFDSFDRSYLAHLCNGCQVSMHVSIPSGWSWGPVFFWNKDPSSTH